MLRLEGRRDHRYRSLAGRGTVLAWPARSPDLSPIEHHVWDQLGHQRKPSANLQDLEGQLQQLWATGEDTTEGEGFTVDTRALTLFVVPGTVRLV
uniref:Tc1-like transposase DDE domain-containing protein n=1 Tax=Paramormyrops kingsleyae TaxID=1676925 RepID=A0A3B3RYP7_9TELE